jgi:anti-sigma regulatory factor (Ser/Thr protein kinase)
MRLIQTDRFEEAPNPSDPARSCLQASYPAIPTSLPAARRAIAEFAAIAGARDEQLDAIRLASSEGVSNVVLHAYPWQSGQLHVTARVASGELWVLISDDGCGMRAERDSPGLGLGLAVISQMTDGFTVFERWSGGTELRLRFVLRPGDSGRSQERGSDSSATRAASSRFSKTR